MAYIRIDHVALEVSDLARSTAFYEKHFGFETYSRQTVRGGLQINYLRLGGTVLELVGEQREPVQGFHFCLISDGFDEAVRALEEAGVEYVTKPHPTGARVPDEEGWRRVVFRGPDGEQIEIRG